jgi:beta-carotene hydroxylase
MVMGVDIKDAVSEEFSFEKEKAVAKKYAQRFQWEMILIGIGQACVWLSLWPLVMFGIIPLWLGFVVACFCACMAYLPSHEAQHGNYSRGDPKKRWIDALVGHITLITVMFPYEILRVTHMKHHAYTNHDDKDPDFLTSNAKSVKEVILLSLDGTSPDYQKYKEVYSSDAAFQKAFEKGVKVSLAYRLTLMSLVFLFPLQTLLLWWLPAKIGVLYTTLFFSYYPHIGTEIGRYKNTRFWQHWMPRYINHSMQLHFVHHLHPNIAHYDEPRAIEELKPFLIARGVPGAEEIPDRITYNPLIKI